MDPVLRYAKAYASLVGTIVTALLGVFTADTPTGKVLTVIAIVATAVATWAVPNKDVTGTHQDESVQPPEFVPPNMVPGDAEPFETDEPLDFEDGVSGNLAPRVSNPRWDDSLDRGNPES